VKLYDNERFRAGTGWKLQRREVGSCWGARVLEKFWEIPRRLCTSWRYTGSRQALAQFKKSAWLEGALEELGLWKLS